MFLGKGFHARDRAPQKSYPPLRHDEFHITPMVVTSPISRDIASVGLSTYSPNRDSWPAVNARLYSYRSSHRRYRLFQPKPTYGIASAPKTAANTCRTNLFDKYTNILLILRFYFSTTFTNPSMYSASHRSSSLKKSNSFDLNFDSFLNTRNIDVYDLECS